MFGSMGQSAIKNLGNGGEMDGDVTITGDLEVQGGISLSVDEVVQGTSTIDVTNTEALLVRKNDDGGDVFVVDTTNKRVGINSTPSRTFQVDGTASATTATGYFYTNAIHTGVDTQSVVSIRSDNASSNGNVLHVQGDGTGNLLTLSKDGSDKLTVTHEGNVGIGTSTPSSFDSEANNLVVGTGSGDNGITIYTGSSAGHHGSIFFGDGTGTPKQGQIRYEQNNEVMSFFTNTAEKMRIDASGNVTINSGSAIQFGDSSYKIIGSTAGNYLRFYTESTQALQIDDSQNATFAKDLIVGTHNSNSHRLEIESRHASVPFGQIVAGSADNNQAVGLQFTTRDSNGAENDTMFLTSTGLGIGTSDPSNRMLKVLQTSGDGSVEISTNDTSNAFLKFGTDSDGSERGGFVGIDYSDQVLRLNYGSGFDGTNNGLAIGASTATFAGNVTSNGNILSQGASAPSISVLDTTNNASIQMRALDSEVRFGTTSNHPVKIGTNDSYDVIVLGTDKSATFGGDVAIGSAIASYTDAISTSQTLSVGENQDSSDKLASVQIIGRGSSSTDTLGALEFINTRSGSGVVSSIVGGRFNGGSASDGSLSFNTKNGSSLTTKMTINDVGRVGIGTVSPAGLIHLTSSSADGNIIVESTHASSSAVVDIRSVADRDSSVLFREGTTVKARIKNDASADALVLTDGADTTTLTLAGTNATFAQKIGVGASPQSFPDKNVTIEGTSAGLVLRDSTGDNQATQWGTLFTSNNNVRMMYDDSGTFQVGNADNYQGTNYEINLRIDANSRISLSNNDSGTSNTVFGKLAGDDLASGGNYNSFFGDNTGGNTTGDYNVAIGMQALKSLPDGDKNVAIGVNAMEAQDNTANGLNDCVAIGFEAFQGTNAGTSAPSGTVAIGSQSLKALTSGASNTAVGYQSAQTLTTGASNVSIGYQAMGNANLGSDKNVMIGKSAFFNGEVDEAVFIGFNAGGDGTTTTGANGTVGIGKSVLNALTSGARNTAVGYQSLMTENTGSYHTSLGYQALKVVDAPNGHNTGLGHKAGVAISSGSSNTVVGSSVAEALTTGTNNTIVGASANVSASGATNEIVIGQGVTGRGDNMAVIGNDSINNVYLSRDGGAKAHMASIQFPATQNASSNANCLDDYEEGTYTPAISDGSTTFSCSTANGYYTKIGNQVFVQVTMVTSENGSGSSLQITLPFNYNAGGSKFITAPVRYGGLDLDSSAIQVMLGNSASGTSNQLFFSQMRDDNTELTLAGTSMSSGDTIRFNVHYIVA